MHPNRLALSFCAAAALVCAPSAYSACSTAGCAVNTHWETQGPHLGSGLRVDLRVEHIKQNTLRSGTKKVAHPEPETGEEHEEGEEHHEEEHEEAAAHATAQQARPQHEGEHHAEHDERETVNRNLIARFDYNINANWGVSLELPVLARKHRHIELEGGAEEKWDFTALGDARLKARYVFAGDAAMSWGVSFGAKLPTGKFDQENDAGEHAERSLQPGSGTTDALLSAFYQRSAPASAWSWFGQVALQQALNSRDEYKPGRLVSADAGAAYRIAPQVSAMLQLNLQHRARDKGANAEAADSGGEFAFLSPGVQLRLGDNTQAYAFVQVPLYQHVNGTQLTADKALLLGLSHRF